jgi:hypothetical protein
MEIGEWLRNLGLERYEAAFRENEIDDRILPKLTAEDLKEVGVAIVGHRRRMLTEIAELSNPPPLPVEAAASVPVAGAIVGRATFDAGERRQLTVSAISSAPRPWRHGLIRKIWAI